MSKAIYWLLTIPHHLFTPYLNDKVNYIKGQLERGQETGYLHWQILIALKKQSRLSAVKEIFGNEIHAEPSRSAAANDYVWKDETAVESTRFELGNRPIKRGHPPDWAAVLGDARTGNWDAIPPDIYIRNYSSLKRINVENMRPSPFDRTCNVYWGTTGSGKTHAAWEEAGMDSYPKDPCTKFWDGYQGQAHVIIDEFRGNINISHLLRWLDRYPVLVEIKGSSVILKATTFWITSNIHPNDWYPDLDSETKSALLRRMNIKHFLIPFQ